MDLSFLLGGPAGAVRMPDPVQQYGTAMSLAQLARQNRIGDLAEREQSRRLEEEDAYRAALPALLQAGFSREAVLQAIQADPRIGQRAVTEADARQKSEADLAGKRASTFKDSVEAKAKAMDDIEAIANAEASKPNPSLSRVQRVAEFYGVPLPQVRGDDPESLRGYIQSLADAGISVKDQIAVKQKDRDFTAGEVEKMWRREFDTGRQAETVKHNRTSEGLIARGQNISAETSRRGQDLLSDRAKEANEIAARAVSPAALQSLAQNEVTLAKIEKARQLVKANPGATGLANYLPDAVRQRTDPAGVTTRALIADIAGQKIHDRSGAAVTVGEAERLRPYVPNLTDDDKTIEQKLALFDSEYRQIQHELALGKSLADVVRGRAGEVSGAIGGAPSGANGWSAVQVKPGRK